jgi:TRAP-type mannitol/chloroaromatic compound transport system permease large subunit
MATLSPEGRGKTINQKQKTKMFKALSLPSFLDVTRPVSVSARSLARRHTPAKQKTNPKIFIASLALLAVNVVVLGMYFVGVNTYAGKGYEIRSLQSKLVALNEDQKKLNLKIAEQSSVLGLQTDFANAHYVPVSGATFLQTNQFSMK